MTREEAVKLLARRAKEIKEDNVLFGDTIYCELLCFMEIAIGMKPPTVKVVTPLGARIFYETNEWEEKIHVDEAGYDPNNSGRACINPKCRCKNEKK